jgi:hypothetical protein
MWTAGNRFVIVSNKVKIMREKEYRLKLKVKRTQIKHSVYLHTSY